MPVNRNALIRYRTIDRCLQNRYRKWTLDDLVEACSDTLYEYEGIDKGVSKRTVQMDIQMMRSDKLGYFAPIVVVDKKYYTYEDPAYSITNIPLTEQDLGKLTEVVDILRQFKGFTHFHDLNGMVQRLEDRIHTAKTTQPSVIDLEKNEHLKGLEWLDTIYQAIIRKQVLEITYQSFTARKASVFTFHAYLLKEYRNRWFILGISMRDISMRDISPNGYCMRGISMRGTKKKGQPLLTLALDRIIGIQPSDALYIENMEADLSRYFAHVVGVSVNPNDPPEQVELFIDSRNAPYVLTKPLHHSQQLVKKIANGIIVRLHVQLNFELEREILGFGDCIKVLQPEKLKRRIRQKMENAAALYQHELKPTDVASAMKRIHRRGFVLLDTLYTKQEADTMLSMISRAQQADQWHEMRQLLESMPRLERIIFNQNLTLLMEEGFGQSYTITSASYLEKPETSGSWLQHAEMAEDLPAARERQHDFIVYIYLDQTDTTDIQVIPRTYKNKLTSEQLNEISATTEPVQCEVRKGGIMIVRPFTLYRYAGGCVCSRMIRLVFGQR